MEVINQMGFDQHLLTLIGMEVTTTDEYSSFFYGGKLEGRIVSISRHPDQEKYGKHYFVATIEGKRTRVDGKPKVQRVHDEPINLYWLRFKEPVVTLKQVGAKEIIRLLRGGSLLTAGEYKNLEEYVYLQTPTKADENVLEGAMLREYQKEKGRFMEYFNLIGKEHQQSLVERIRVLDKKEQNLCINAWLFDLGLDGLYLDFMELYHNNPLGFMEYMEGSDDAERREVIEKLYTLDEDKHNEETDTLLERNRKYRDLIEVVGIRMIKEPGDEDGELANIE